MTSSQVEPTSPSPSPEQHYERRPRRRHAAPYGEAEALNRHREIMTARHPDPQMNRVDPASARQQESHRSVEYWRLGSMGPDNRHHEISSPTPRAGRATPPLHIQTQAEDYDVFAQSTSRRDFRVDGLRRYAQLNAASAPQTGVRLASEYGREWDDAESHADSERESRMSRSTFRPRVTSSEVAHSSTRLKRRSTLAGGEIFSPGDVDTRGNVGDVEERDIHMVEHRVLEDGPKRTVTLWRQAVAKSTAQDDPKTQRGHSRAQSQEEAISETHRRRSRAPGDENDGDTESMSEGRAYNGIWAPRDEVRDAYDLRYIYVTCSA
jgi:hypothetical protein